MSQNEDKLIYNFKECDYDYYGDTRNNQKYNEEKPCFKLSHNAKMNRKTYYSIMKKEMQRENYIQAIEEMDMKQKKEEEKEEDEKNKNDRKRKLKFTEIEDENYGNNYEKLTKKNKKHKMPRKDRIRF